MVGAGVPRGGEVVLSTARLTELGPVDRASAQVEAGAGVTLAARAGAARARAGLDAGVDFAARDSATVGGLAATNAGGIRAMRYGTVRARVAGLQAVLADGSIIERPTLLKDNAGYDLSALLVGSEGTLGDHHRRPLAPGAAAHQPRGRADRPAVARPGGRSCSPTCARGCPRWTPPSSSLDEGLQLVLDHLGLPAPVPTRSPVYVLLECAALADPTDELAEALGAGGDRGRGRGRRQRRARAAVALPRGPHRGALGRGHPAQDGRRRTAGAAGRVRRRACARRWRAWPPARA